MRVPWPPPPLLLAAAVPAPPLSGAPSWSSSLLFRIHAETRGWGEPAQYVQC